MGTGDEVAALVAGAYAAALNEARWADWAWQAARLLGGTCGTLHVVDRTHGIRHQTLLHEDVRAVERYLDEEIYRLDPQLRFVGALPQSRVYDDLEQLDLTDPAAREYVAWQRSNGNLRHYVTAAAVLDDRRQIAGLSVHRAVADGPTPDASRRIMERLLPDLHRALELGFAHAEKLNDAYWDGLLTLRSEPGLLLDEAGRVLRMTPALAAILSAGDGLRCVQGRLAASAPATDARLQRFVGQLVQGLAPAACSVERRSGRAPYVLTGYPLPRRSRMLAPAEAVALVRLVDPAGAPIAAAAVWQSAFDLTAREVELAAALVAGRPIDRAAALLGITVATARVHLRNLFAKTQTPRQAELVRLLTRLLP